MNQALAPSSPEPTKPVTTVPTQNVTNRCFSDLFEGPVRYVIPFFQRGYAWQKRQWDDLFSDLNDEILTDLNDGKPLAEIEHFFGPMVVQQRFPAAEGPLEYLVVDGQQRITTVYVLLGIIKELISRRRSASEIATDHTIRLNELLSNTVPPGDDYKRLKIYSTKGDRLPTYRAIFGDEQNPKSPSYDTDIKLYRPGFNKVDDFRSYATRKVKSMCPDVPTLWQLSEALLHCLKVVWIPLQEGKDDAQAIFESLNDKGMPLSASELLCSYLFRPLMASEDFEHLHNSQWLEAIRISKDREGFEEYLRHLFSIGERKVVGKGRKIYVDFKSKNRQLNSSTARARLGEIFDGAAIYQRIVDPTMNPHYHQGIRKCLESISYTRMDSASPFVLAVLRDTERQRLAVTDAEALLREVIVLLVRRKMTEQSTTLYDTLFPNLLGRIMDEPDRIRAMQDQFKKSGAWVSDQEFEEAFMRRPLYRSRDIPFTRYVLIELDRKLATHGQWPDYSTLPTVEHVIPQELSEDWKEYLGSDASSEQLATLIHTTGNLCLMSQQGNSHAGQDCFAAKTSAYSEVTALARGLKCHVGPWNLESVRERSKRLAKVALDVWPWSNR